MNIVGWVEIGQTGNAAGVEMMEIGLHPRVDKKRFVDETGVMHAANSVMEIVLAPAHF